MEVEQSGQKTTYDYRAYGPACQEEQPVLVILNKKRGKTKNSFIYKAPHTISEIFSDLVFRICRGTQKTLKVHYDRLNQYK